MRRSRSSQCSPEIRRSGVIASEQEHAQSIRRSLGRSFRSGPRPARRCGIPAEQCRGDQADDEQCRLDGRHRRSGGRGECAEVRVISSLGKVCGVSEGSRHRLATGADSTTRHSLSRRDGAGHRSMRRPERQGVVRLVASRPVLRPALAARRAGDSSRSRLHCQRSRARVAIG